MATAKFFNHVHGNHPRTNKFDLSYSNTFSAQIGYLYPVSCDLVYPGSFFKNSFYLHAEIQPLVAPIMCDVQIFVHQFFVPLRLLFGFDPEDGENIWEKFISGGKDGLYSTPLPSWTPDWTDENFSSKKIWDYVGLPVVHEAKSLEDSTLVWRPRVPADIQVLDIPKRAYNFIYNELYRDEMRIDEVDLTSEDLQRVSFRKDYFTSAIDSPVLGPVSALPLNLSGILPVVFVQEAAGKSTSGAGGYGLRVPTDYDGRQIALYNLDGSGGIYAGTGRVSASVDSSGISSTTFDVNELRFSFAVQRLLELSAISGVRYTEFLSAHFGVSPSDSRLDRPEYIGGQVVPLLVSPSVQTSGTDDQSVSRQQTPQGNKSGIGSVDTVLGLGKYRVLEHGVIMTMLSIRPKPIYKQGVNRQWLCPDGRYSFYFPEFAFLGEQPIYNCELYTDPDAVDEDNNKLDSQVFGYQSAWNFLRSKTNMVSGAVRDQFSYWTMAREFDQHPALNKDFLEIVNTDFNQIFAVQNEDEFVINFSNLSVGYLPLPLYSNPGLIDHVYGQ